MDPVREVYDIVKPYGLWIHADRLRWSTWY
ncbi:hypothetical protein ACEQPO_08830 [Bacillus sp. SL00103]